MMGRDHFEIIMKLATFRGECVFGAASVAQSCTLVPSGLVYHAGCFPALKRRAILKLSLRDKGT
jgi:hypothetical protein